VTSGVNRCVFREGERVPLRDAASKRCEGVTERELIEAIDVAERSLRYFSYVFARFSKARWGLRISLAESMPIRVRQDESGAVILSGFWSGIIGVELASGRYVELVVTPRVEAYPEMIRAVESILKPISLDFDSLLHSLAYTRTGPPFIPYLEPLLYMLQILALREPKRLCRVEGAPAGTLALLPVERIVTCVDNKGLGVLVGATVRILAEALRDLRKYSRGLEKVSKALAEVVEGYVSRVSQASSWVLSQLDVPAIDRLDDEALSQLERYLDTLYAFRRVARTVRIVGAKGVARGFAYPSTKLYELYVYAKILECLNGSRARYAGKLAVEVNGTHAYFNHVPPRYSRVVKPLAGRPPRPDITLKMGDQLLVVEAKYRELDSKLLPADALRLAGYLADIARDTSLKALVTTLKCNQTHITKEIDGRHIEVNLIEVNPDKKVDCNEILKHLT